MFTCPVTTVRAPLSTVWRLLSEPSEYERWVDATLVSVEPPGALQAGQVVRLRTRAAGRWWPVRWDVLDVDPRQSRIGLDVHLPLGIVNHEVIVVRPVSEDQTFVAFN
jgi:hypothetical protein